MFRCPPYVWMMFGCPLCKHNTKISMLCQTKGMSIWPHTCLDGPLYVWMSPVCLDGHPLYIWMPSICLAAPLHVWTPLLNVWYAPMMFGHPDCMGGVQTYRGIHTYGDITKTACFVTLMECHPLSLTKHAFFVLYMYSRHPNIFQTYGGIQTYGGCPNIWECPHIFRGHPNIGYPNIQEGIQTYGSIQTYRKVSKHGGHPNIQGLSKHMGASKHTGDTSK